MENIELEEMLALLESKVSVLVQEYEKLKLSVEQLKSQNAEQKQVIEKQKETIKNFKNQPQFANIAESLAGDEENKKALKIRIDQYIKDIDRCIELLND